MTKPQSTPDGETVWCDESARNTAEALAQLAAQFREYLSDKTISISSDNRKYIVTDGVLYEDEYPLAFKFLTGES